MSRLQHYTQHLEQVLQQGLQAGVFPGAVVYLTRGVSIKYFEAVGLAEVMPQQRPMQRDTLFDIASLTKVVATLPAVLRSIQSGLFNLDDPIAKFFPHWANPSPADARWANPPQVNPPDGYARAGVTVFHLLTHTSGLPGWRPFYIQSATKAEYLEHICHEPLVYEPGSQVVYSDLGFMLLGFLLEHVWSRPLDAICRDLVFTPLGLGATAFRPGLNRERDGEPERNQDAHRHHVAATERGNACERQMALDYAHQVATGQAPGASFHLTREEVEHFSWRTEVTRGEVNDGNAYYGLQGVGGHAGLFSTAADLHRYLRVWTDNQDEFGRPFLRADLIHLATSNQTPRLHVARALGFEATAQATSASAQQLSSAGLSASPGAFGHTGFTGTSLWVDRRTGTYAVALTNRVHPEVKDKDEISRWRRTFHSAAFANLT